MTLDMVDIAPIYRPRHFGASKADGLRPFAAAGRYNYRGYALPDRARVVVAARGQIEDEISVRPGSFLTTISSVSSQAAGFKFNIYDKATGSRLFSEDVRDTVAASAPIARFAGRRLANYLQSPWAVPSPGLLTVRIVNLATAANDLQLYLAFAEPSGGSIRERVRG